MLHPLPVMMVGIFDEMETVSFFAERFSPDEITAEILLPSTKFINPHFLGSSPKVVLDRLKTCHTSFSKEKTVNQRFSYMVTRNDCIYNTSYGNCLYKMIK